MTAWHEGRVTANELAAAGLHALHLDVSGTALVGTHALPGQYVKVALDGFGEGVFAIASAPSLHGDTFELLVKGGSDLADALIAAPVGTRVRVTTPEGPGFPIERARGHRVLLFATGSGISAIRSLIHAISHERPLYRSVTLYFGARTPDAFAYRTELADWQRAGIQVVRTVSQPGAPGWQELEGYVQQHLPQERFEDAVAFVCGQAEMVEGVKEALRHRGMPESQIFQNL